MVQASELRVILNCYSRLTSKYHSITEGSSKALSCSWWLSADAAEKLEDPELGWEEKEGVPVLTANVASFFAGWNFLEFCLYQTRVSSDVGSFVV